MARPTWKGTITFGLVNIPVSLFPGERRSDLSFRMLDSRNNARVRYERVNEETGEEVPWDQIVKAFEYDGGNYVVLTDEDFDRVAVEQTQTVEIEDFVDADAIPYQYYDKPYILVPGKKGEKGYVLLREALKKTGKVGMAKVVIRTRQYLAAVVPQGDALVLEILRYANEIRKPEEYDIPTDDLSDYKISDKEIAMAAQLIETMSTEWKPDHYHDEYREALMEWIEKKIEAGGNIVPPEPEVEEKKPAGEIIDIMDLLKRSMKETEKRRATGGNGGAKARRAEADDDEDEEAPAPKKAAPKAKAKAKAKPAAKAKAKPAARKKAS
jgi:DNA end-binding protein Ku